MKLYTCGGGCRVVRKIHLRLCANRELVYHSPLIYKIPYKTPYSLKKIKYCSITNNLLFPFFLIVVRLNMRIDYKNNQVIRLKFFI